MDVRCEKCQTEYELDEARLKPSGVTVKCTHCGHMFRIRKKSSTASTLSGPVVAPPTASGASVVTPLPRQPVARDGGATAAAPAPRTRASTNSGVMAAQPDGTEREWRLRLENGEQRSCKELATLQQWIVAGIATRESLISRNGRTWKRLGDIVELSGYFSIHDEARESRARGDRSTLMGVGTIPGAPPASTDDPHGAVTVAAQTMNSAVVNLRETGVATGPNGDADQDDEDNRITGDRSQPFPAATGGSSSAVPNRGGNQYSGESITAVSPAVASGPIVAESNYASSAVPVATTAGASHSHRMPRAATTPPPAPAGRASSKQLPIPPPPEGMATGEWANAEGARPAPASAAPPFSGAVAVRQTQAFSGRATGATNEPAFAANASNRIRVNTGGSPDRSGNQAGLVRTEPGADVFARGKHPDIDDETGPIDKPPSSRAGLWIAIVSLVAIAAAAAALYFLVLRRNDNTADTARTTASATTDAAPGGTVDASGPDAASAAAQTDATAELVHAATVDLAGDLDTRLATLATELETLPAPQNADPRVLAVRALVATARAQHYLDAVALANATDKNEEHQRSAKQQVLTALSLAQRALKAAPAPAHASLAMADVLRLQGKSQREVKRFTESATATDASLQSLAAIINAQLTAKEGKLTEAEAALAAQDVGAAQLEQTGDVRVRFRRAVLHFQNGNAEKSKKLVESVLALQPQHEGAKALFERLTQTVDVTDPLPPEEGATQPPATVPSPTPSPGAGGDSYDQLVRQANQLAENSCSRAIVLFNRALDEKPNGVEALVGVGYCSLDAKQYATAFSKFRAALAISPRNERALWGVAETYQQQGRKEQAIESYQRYLEVYPDAGAAKRQIERLGGGTGSAPAPSPTTPNPPPSSPAPAPSVPSPTPTEQPQKADE